VGHDEESRGTDPALGSTMVDKGPLDGSEAVIFSQSLHGDDLRTLDLGERDEAGIDGHAIDDHGARPALSLAASLLGAGESETLSQHIEEPRHGWVFDLYRGSIDDEFGHWFSMAAMTRSGVMGS